jgi:hypothetical protein
MTKITDYLWQLPHEPLADDPPEIEALQREFNQPLVDALSEPLGGLGYDLRSSDVVVKLDERLDNTRDTYYANLRFIKYLAPDILTRVHFQHDEWALFLPDCHTHIFYVNLDRFKIQDAYMTLVPNWEGRLHTRMSSRPDNVLHHNGPDQLWAYRSPDEMTWLLELFLDKFERLGVPYLEHLYGA